MENYAIEVATVNETLKKELPKLGLENSVMQILLKMIPSLVLYSALPSGN